MAETGRVYAGRSVAERRAERRARLLAAAYDVFGTDGWRAGTIERLCAAAGVATRAFYEEFDRREDLLLAVAESVLSEAVDTLQSSLAAAPADPGGRIRAGIGGYVAFLTDDPRRVRILYREVRAAGGLEPERHRAAMAFAAILADESARLPAASRLADQPLLGLALVGAVTELLADWAAAEPAPPTAPLVDALVTLFTAVAG
jgi:AcrR family transcriptional regulator